MTKAYYIFGNVLGYISLASLTGSLIILGIGCYAESKKLDTGFFVLVWIGAIFGLFLFGIVAHYYFYIY